MTDEDTDGDGTVAGLSRRQILTGTGTIGGAALLGGATTTSLLWDEEKFGTANDPNVLQGGDLDLKVDWEVNYYDWIDSTPQTIAESELTDQPGPIIELEDVKPGDVVETTLSAHVFGNPAFLGWHYEEHLDSDNGITEPEDKVNGHTPDDSDGDPFAAGLGMLGSGLLGSALGGRVFDDPDEDSDVAETETEDGGLVSRKNLLRAGTAAAAGAAGAAAFSGGAAAAPGDLLAEVDLPQHSSGVGIAFDGTYVYTVDGLSSSTLQVYSPPGASSGTATLEAEKAIVDGSGNSVAIEGFDWDPTRNMMWGASNSGSSPVYLIDVGDPTDPNDDAVATHQFDAPSVTGFSLMDGVAYDGQEDNIWLSGDVNSFVHIFDTDGTELPGIDPLNEDGSQAEQISGLAVGAEVGGRRTVFLGRNGQSRITRHFVDDGTFVEEFANLPFRVEDLACDGSTYSPTEAILTKDAFDGFYVAFEVESGTCLSGGVEPEPAPQEDDGELDDVMWCVSWYDDGNNIPEEIWTGDTDLGDPGPDDELDEETLEEFVMEVGEAQHPDEIVDTDAAIFAGTLADADGADVLFDARNSIAGSVASDFPDTACYQNSDTEYIGTICWVPRDIPGVNDNVIQTDRLEFQFGFDAIQCRHNVANDGGPIDGTIDEADADNNANSP